MVKGNAYTGKVTISDDQNLITFDGRDYVAESGSRCFECGLEGKGICHLIPCCIGDRVDSKRVLFNHIIHKVIDNRSEFDKDVSDLILG